MCILNQNNENQNFNRKGNDPISLLIGIAALICILLSIFEIGPSQSLLTIGLALTTVANVKNWFWLKKRNNTSQDDH